RELLKAQWRLGLTRGGSAGVKASESTSGNDTQALALSLEEASLHSLCCWPVHARSHLFRSIVADRRQLWPQAHSLQVQAARSSARANDAGRTSRPKVHAHR